MKGTMTTTTTRRPGLISDSAVIAAAMVVMNAANYAFTITAARFLGPTEYGALAAMLGVLMVVNVVSLGLQATAARRVAAQPDARDAIERDVMRATTWCAAGLGLVMLAISPLVSAVLGLDSWLLAGLVAATAVPLTFMGGQAGILQGERRWIPLAAVYLGAGLGRLAFGVAGLLVAKTSILAMCGLLVGAFLPVVVASSVMRRHRGRSPDHPRQHVLRETFHNSHALLAFFALSNVDVVAARVVLPEHDAGLYAGGLILAKAVLFLPQFVVVIVFPSMSQNPAARRVNAFALALVLAAGLAVVAGVAVLPDLALVFVGGPQYAEIAPLLWVFAGLGTVLAMLQLLVYNVLARQQQKLVLLVWATLAGVALLAITAESVLALALIVLAADSLLLLALLAAAMRRGQAVPAR